MWRYGAKRVLSDSKKPVEGEPFYELREIVFNNINPSSGLAALRVRYRSFDVLPPDDAVGLLNGNDQTGLIVWEGSCRLVEWLLSEALLSSPRFVRGSEHLVCVELGCGCGFGSIGVLQYCFDAFAQLAEDSPLVAATILATDVNPECVALAQVNLDDTLCLNESNGCTHTIAYSASSHVYSWGDKAASSFVKSTLPEVLSRRDNSSSLLVFAGDVVYDLAAVTPLFDAVGDVANAFFRSGGPMAAARCVTFVWVYQPRSLTRQANIAIFRAIVSHFHGLDGEWTIEKAVFGGDACSDVWAATIECPHDTFMRLAHAEELSDTEERLFEHCALSGVLFQVAIHSRQ